MNGLYLIELVAMHYGITFSSKDTCDFVLELWHAGLCTYSQDLQELLVYLDTCLSLTLVMSISNTVSHHYFPFLIVKAKNKMTYKNLIIKWYFRSQHNVAVYLLK